MGRVVPIAGDVCSVCFGLAPASYEALSAIVRCVVHCAAEVHMLRQYPALRRPNVLGTLEVLRFVCRTHSSAESSHAKALCYASTTSVLCHRPCSDHIASVQAPLNEPIALEQLDELSGYVQSKVVAERLVLEAARRGVAVGLVRMARIGPSSMGICNPNDLVSRLIRGVAEVKVAPYQVEAHPIAFDMVPVERVAHAMMRMALWMSSCGRNTPRGGATCHLTNCTKPTAWEQLLRDVQQAHGFEVTRVALPEWRSALRSSEALRLLADELQDGIPCDLSFVSDAHDVPGARTLETAILL